jgi:hypothetical protein
VRDDFGNCSSDEEVIREALKVESNHIPAAAVEDVEPPGGIRVPLFVILELKVMKSRIVVLSYLKKIKINVLALYPCPLFNLTAYGGLLGLSDQPGICCKQLNAPSAN